MGRLDIYMESIGIQRCRLCRYCSLSEGWLRARVPVQVTRFRMCFFVVETCWTIWDLFATDFWAQWPVRRIESGSPFGTFFFEWWKDNPEILFNKLKCDHEFFSWGGGNPPPYNIQPGHSNSCSSLCWSNSHGVQSPMYCPLKAKKEPKRLLAFVCRYTMICNDSTLISRLRYRWHGDPCVIVRKLVALPGSCVRLSLPFPGWPNALDEGTREIRLEGPSKLIRAINWYQKCRYSWKAHCGMKVVWSRSVDVLLDMLDIESSS